MGPLDILEIIEDGEEDLAAAFAHYNSQFRLECEKEESYYRVEFLERANKILTNMIIDEFMQQNGWTRNYDDDSSEWVKEEY